MGNVNSSQNIEELRKGSIKSITPQLADLDNATLADLKAAEQNDDNPRESLLAAIEAEYKRRAPLNAPRESGEGGGQSAASPGNSPADQGGSAESEPPAYLADGYTGPLTIEQSERRHRQLAERARQKPAAEPVTK